MSMYSKNIFHMSISCLQCINLKATWARDYLVINSTSSYKHIKLRIWAMNQSLINNANESLNGKIQTQPVNI